METTLDELTRARQLTLPDRQAMLRRDASVQHFWTSHRDMLRNAWSQWDADASIGGSTLDDSLLDRDLRTAVAAAWDEPSTESAVRDLVREEAPGVFSFQFFDPERIAVLRDYLEDAWDAGIPLRPPYGIVLNRRGAMLDPRSEGALGAPTFQAFYRSLLDVYMRPIARLLFPDVTGHDSQTFGFSIHYQPETDTSIRPHSDASAVTLNINANLPGEEFEGSTVDFFDQETGVVTPLRFEPGTAMIHRGRVPHTAQPITSGSRTNLVLWLFGEGGRVPMESSPTEVDAQARWTVPSIRQDAYAPF